MAPFQQPGFLLSVYKCGPSLSPKVDLTAPR